MWKSKSKKWKRQHLGVGLGVFGTYYASSVPRKCQETKEWDSEDASQASEKATRPQEHKPPATAITRCPFTKNTSPGADYSRGPGGDGQQSSTWAE